MIIQNKNRITITELSISQDEYQIYGKLFAPDATEPLPAMIFCHGYNGIHEDFSEECNFFASCGYICYAFDFCGGSTRSKSSGNSIDMTIFTEKANLLAVFEHIRNMDIVDSQRIYILGGSQGGLVSALAAEELGEDLAGLILYYPALNIPDDWRKNYPSTEAIPEFTDFWGLRLGRNFFLSIHDFKVYDHIGSYSGKVFIIHGDLDEIAPPIVSQKALRLYPNARLLPLSHEGHGFSPKGLQTAMEHIRCFLSEN